METLKNMNEILNIIYLICAGPILIYIAYKGLEQIKAAKENTLATQNSLKIQSKREAFKLAGEQCVYFAEKIIPLFSKLMKELETNESKFFEKFIVKIDEEKLGVELKEELNKKDFEGLEKSEYLQDLLNSLEGYSMFFASGVAAEKVGYVTAGRGYCQIIKKLSPLLIPEFEKGYYKNTLFLFNTWHNRCNQDDIKMKQKELEKELNKTTEMKIPTIGVD